MRNVNIIDVDSAELFKEVISGMNTNNPNKTILKQLEEDILDRYRIYQNSILELELLGEESIIEDDQHKKALIKGYTRDRQTRFGRIANRIIAEESKNGKKTCPYCELTDSTRLDHYIPKCRMPEYAMLIENLIPSCTVCNEEYKKELWLEQGERIFINPYWDDWLQYKFLYAEVIDEEIPIIKYKLKKPSEITQNHFQILSAHFKRLNLKKRYETKVSEKIVFNLEKFNKYKFRMRNKFSPQQIIDSYKENVRDELEIARIMYGVNNWETCFYEALLESNCFFRVEEIDEQMLSWIG